MANPVSIVQAIIDLALKIKNQVETFRHNRKDCRRIGELVATVRAVAEGLRETTEKEDGGTLLGGALKALKQALERAWDLVVACQRKNTLLRALEAEAIAVKLRGVYLDVSLNLSAAVLANGACNTSNSKLADINGIVAALRAEVAYNTWMLEHIMEFIAALPDVHLRQQVARLVHSDSTDETHTYDGYQGAQRQSTVTSDQQRYDGAAASVRRPSIKIDSYCLYWEGRWYWWSSGGWIRARLTEYTDGRRYPVVTIAVLTMDSFDYGMDLKILTEPPQDLSPDSVIEIKDMAEWQKHWDGAAKYSKLLVYEFYDKNSSLYKAVDKLLERLAKQYKGIVDFRKLDVDNFEFLARLCGVEGAYPTFAIFNNCKQVGKVVGLKEEELERSIRRELN